MFFGTTNMGRTVAIDANEGKVLWEYTAPGFDEATANAGAPSPMGHATSSRSPIPRRWRMTTASSSTPQVPMARSTKISIADGKGVWSTAVTKMP